MRDNRDIQQKSSGTGTAAEMTPRHTEAAFSKDDENVPSSAGGRSQGLKRSRQVAMAQNTTTLTDEQWYLLYHNAHRKVADIPRYADEVIAAWASCKLPRTMTGLRAGEKNLQR